MVVIDSIERACVVYDADEVLVYVIGLLVNLRLEFVDSVALVVVEVFLYDDAGGVVLTDSILLKLICPINFLEYYI